MGVTQQWRSAAYSHPGRMREDNQDRSHVDDHHGIFLVVDGLGGHAAGEKAADAAVDVIAAELQRPDQELRQRIRTAITAANNRIWELASSNEDWAGMACVLTLAVVEDGKVIAGHVGDSRLYLIWNGAMKKLTSDHSPVGEREDAGELTEAEAMQHPRRNEVFRDVGSRRREPDEENFIEVKEFMFKPDAAILLCSDGLTDLVPAAVIRDVIEHYDGDPDKVARDLVDAANRAGGNDNVTAIFVAGNEFMGTASPAMTDARARHSITRMRPELASGPEPAPAIAARLGGFLTTRAAFLVYGFLIGVLLALAVRY